MRSNKKKTHEEFLQEVYEAVGNEYTVLGHYEKTHIKVLIQHNVCGHKWNIEPNSFINRGSRCPICVRKKAGQNKTITNEQFKKEVYGLVGTEYEFLEKYIGTRVKIPVRHNKCGYVWDITPSSFTSKGTRCPKCSLKSRSNKRRKSSEVFAKEVFDLVGDEYTVLGQYKNTHTKILIRHNLCRNEFLIAPNDFLHGQRCPREKDIRIGISNSKSHEKFIDEVHSLVGDEYFILSQYCGNKKPVYMLHTKCKKIFKCRPNDFLSGHKCPYCGGTHKLTHEEFIKKVHDLVNCEYSVLGQYLNVKTKLKFTHNKCGHIFLMAAGSFLSGQRCPKCAGNMRKNTEKFKKEVKQLVGDEYTLLTEYQNSKTHVLMRHNKCGYQWMIKPNNFTGGNRCPRCNESHGEITIRHYLRKNHIKFRSQYKIKECKNKRQLPFDFALFNIDKLIALVEFDGQQHTEVVERFGGAEGLNKRQHNDAIKTNYCLAHNIPLIRISYKVKNIEKYLENELSKLNKEIQLSVL